MSKQDHAGRYEVNAISGDTQPVNRSILGSGTRAVTSYSSLGPTGGGRERVRGGKDPYKNFTMEVKMLKWARKKLKK